MGTFNRPWADAVKFSVVVGGATGNGTADDSAAVNAVVASYNAVATAQFAGGYTTSAPPVGQSSGVYFPAGWYNCPTASLTGTGNGWTVYGDGVASVIIGGTITLNAYLAHAHDLSLWNSPNSAIGTGTAITIAGSTLERIVQNIAIQKYNIGAQIGNLGSPAGAYDIFDTVQIRSCNTGIVCSATQGLSLTNVEVNSCAGDGITVQGAGEIKALNLRVMASGAVNTTNGGGTGSLVGAVGMRLLGQPRSPVFECYWTNVTLTETNRRQVPITSVQDNGSGGTRFYTSITWNYTAIQAQNGAFVPSTFYPGVYEATMGLPIATLGSSVTSILVGGTTELLSAPVAVVASVTQPNGSPVETSRVIAAAINAGTSTHHYTATGGTNNVAAVWLQAPDGSAAIFRTVVVTTSDVGVKLVPDAYTWIDMGAPHDFVVGEDVALTNYLIGGVPTYGFSTVYYAPSDSVPAVIPGYVNSHILALGVPYGAGSTGTAVRPNMLSAGLFDGRLFCAGYTTGATLRISAVADNYFEDSTIPFAGNSNGYMTIKGWDLFIDGTISRSVQAADQFFEGGNINYVRIRSGFGVRFNGTRIKTEFFIDPRLDPAERSDRILWVSTGRAVAHVNPYDTVSITGAQAGWKCILITDTTLTPGDDRLTLIAPTGVSSVDNEIGVSDSAIVRRVSGHNLDITLAKHPLTDVHAALQALLTDTAGVLLQSGATGLAAKILAFSTLGSSQSADLNLFSWGSAGSAINFWTGATSTGGSNAVRTARFGWLANGVNYWNFFPGIAGSPPSVGVSGNDNSNVVPLAFGATLQLVTKATATFVSPTFTGALGWVSDGYAGAGPYVADGVSLTRVLTDLPGATVEQTTGASIATTNLRVNGVKLPAGKYKINYYINVTATATGSVLAMFGWTDPNGARTSSSASVDTSGLNFTQGSVVVRSSGAVDVTYTTTLVGSASYYIYVSVERLP